MPLTARGPCDGTPPHGSNQGLRLLSEGDTLPGGFKPFASTLGERREPESGIEPLTYPLRVRGHGTRPDVNRATESGKASLECG